MDENIREDVHKRLQNLATLDEARLLFRDLNYDPETSTLPRSRWKSDKAVAALAEDPRVIASHDRFNVVYCRMANGNLSRGDERAVVTELLRDTSEYGVFLFSTKDESHWDFVNVKYDQDRNRRRVFRRITIGPDERVGNRLWTASERLAGTYVSSNDLSALDVQNLHERAFDVEQVTEDFFKKYRDVHIKLKDDLVHQTSDQPWAHEYALQFLNRIMFLYFIQRKRWLGNDTQFVRNFWHAYKTSDQDADSFYHEWLKVLFFEAFNNRYGRSVSPFPDSIHKALLQAPYLNGGLFTENDLDRAHHVKISDSQFQRIFALLENYNFTITEDSPLDQEVAVDPEMIGKVYESLVNVSDEADERGDAGIFYTPRIEIDLMCRLALVDNLANRLGADHKNLFYEAVFALEEEDKQSADNALSYNNLWPEISNHINKITVLDPACGSGSFLVGMLRILDDLAERANKISGERESTYDRRMRIIGRSLYGVDVKNWAVHITELRLWLQLIVDTPFKSEELTLNPLLPNLAFKIRQGDSLVQQVGGIDLAHLKHAGSIPRHLMGELNKLKGEKLKYFYNDPSRHYRSAKQLHEAELGLFRKIIDYRLDAIKVEFSLDRREAQQQAMNIPGESIKPAQQRLSLQARNTESLREENEALRRVRSTLGTTRTIPFVWDIAFVEVFQGNEDGFDIVVGNPPYVRQEDISDPSLPRTEAIQSEKKRAYKEKLANSVYDAFPAYFGNKSTGRIHKKLDGKSDLYIYFYFHGMSLLNRTGTFCFITSNSWLDAGYGAQFQEFLIRQSEIRLIIDNEAHRSFASAGVNTIITLLAAPMERGSAAIDYEAKFVMFLAPFEQMLSPVIFQEIDEASGDRSVNEYRLVVINQAELLTGNKRLQPSQAIASGLRTDGNSEYIGDKWGAKYLRAPSIYNTIMEKGALHLQQLGNYFIGERYLNTGGADGFFILTNVEPTARDLYAVRNHRTLADSNDIFEGEIEQRYLVPLIKDYVKSDRRMEIQGHDAYCLVVNDRPSKRLAQYIEWGEGQGYDKRSVTKTQNPWFKPTRQMLNAAPILVPRSFNDTFVIYHNPHLYLSLRFYRLHPKLDITARLAGYLNSTLIAFFLETLGNKNLGDGALGFYMSDFLSMWVPVIIDEEIDAEFDMIKMRPVLDVTSELTGSTDTEQKVGPLPDRKALDDIIFERLMLTQGERDAVYESVVDQVRARLDKARSLKSAAGRKGI